MRFCPASQKRGITKFKNSVSLYHPALTRVIRGIKLTIRIRIQL